MISQKILFFTELDISDISLPKKHEGNKVIYDTKVKGLCVIVSYGGSKTFYYLTKIKGITKRIKIEKFNNNTNIDAVRDKAIHLQEIYSKQCRSFNFAYSQYIEEYAKKNNNIKYIHTLNGYFENHLKEIKEKALVNMKSHEIENLYNKLIFHKGIYIANRSMSLMKSVFNAATDWHYVSKKQNQQIQAIKIISDQKAKIKNKIDNSTYQLILNAFHSSADDVFIAAVQMAISTKTTIYNIIKIKWDDIDLDKQTVKLNGKLLKLSNENIKLLKKIIAISQTHANKNNKVFFNSCIYNYNKILQIWNHLFYGLMVQKVTISNFINHYKSKQEQSILNIKDIADSQNQEYKYI